MYSHEMEGGKPKPALPEDVAKLEARAKSNPSLRPPSKPESSWSTYSKDVACSGRSCSFDFAIFHDCEDRPDNDRIYDCQELPELRHPISDTGDICPLQKTEPCRHMNRTFKTSRTPVTQYNRCAEWIRCHWCGHTHAKTVHSAVCCTRCKERCNNMVEAYRQQHRIHWTVHVTQPPMDAVDITRVCPWTKWGLLLSRFLFRMTPAYLNGITTASEELNAKRRGDPNGPLGEWNPRPEGPPTAAAVVHLGSLKAKT